MEAADDRWAAGDAYEAYMGRWSRSLARVFLEWLDPKRGAHWLEIGCGTGALTAAICDLCEPASVVACDPSPAFIEHARSHASGVCTFSVIPGANAFPSREGGFDVIASGLVLNFVPEPGRALQVMRERSRPGGTIAAYIWDYGGGLELLHHFWTEAIGLDPDAAALDESQRFHSWTKDALSALFRDAGLDCVETGELEMSTDFADFADYWKPFLGCSGPAPSYVASLEHEQRELLRARLEQRLPRDASGRIRLRARAFAVRGNQSVA